MSTPEGREAARELADIANADTLFQGESRLHLEQLAQHAAAYDIGVLDAILLHSKRPAERQAWIARFWARRPTLVERIRAVHDGFVFEEAVAQLESSLLEGITPSASDAASAFDYANRTEAPHILCVDLARILVDAIEREPEAESDPNIRELLLIAHTFLPRPRRKAAKKTTKKAAVSKKRAASQTSEPTEKPAKKTRRRSAQKPTALDLDTGAAGPGKEAAR